MNTIWIVLDEHGELVEFCADELTAHAVKKDWQNRMFDFGARVIERKLKTRNDIQDVIIFEPEDEGMDTFELTLEREVFDA